MSNFLEHSVGIVEDFLQTAVFLDDRAFFDSEVISKDIVEEVVQPDVRGIKVQKEPMPATQAPRDDEEDLSHLLDAKIIIDTFMDKGIVCSVLKCEEGTYDTKLANYIKLIRKADVVVLDWSLFEDDGRRIIELLQTLMPINDKLKEFRSIIIYTANDLENVKKKLKEIGIKFPFHTPYVSKTDNEYTSISLYSKPNAKTAPEGRETSFSEVVNRCIVEFTESFYGVVPNVAMASLSEIRNNTHKLLSVLHKGLDIAYLSHRALLKNPEEAEKHLEEIIISELESIIHENNIGENANYNVLSNIDLIQDKYYQDIEFSQCIEHGIENILSALEESEAVKVKVPELYSYIEDCFTEVWNGHRKVSRVSEKEFTILSTIQSSYTNKRKYLTLGVIIEKDNATNDRYLCIQPRCDSVRLSNNTSFMFLKLQSTGDNSFDILLENVNEKFIVKYNLPYRTMLEFPPVDGHIFYNEDSIFTDIEGNNYKYIASLKRLQAQRIANEYAAYISRVGLNESEYLRRNSPRAISARR